MDKKELEKNVFDLAYQRNLNLLNAILLVGAGSFVAYLAALILDFTKIFEYTLLLIIIGSMTYYFYTIASDLNN